MSVELTPQQRSSGQVVEHPNPEPSPHGSDGLDPSAVEPPGELRGQLHDEVQGDRSRLDLARGLGLLLSLLGFVLGAKVITDNSLLTHLATGEVILENLEVPTGDPYSRTAPGQPWTVQSWLASVVYALVSRTAGLSGLRVLHGLAAFLLTFGLWRLVAPARQVVPRVALTVLPLGLGASFWSPRPLMFGLLAMMVLFLVIRDEWPAWALIPMMWLWVNSHGSFPLAFVLLGAMAVGSWLDQRRIPKAEIRLIGWASAGLAVAALNPLGPRLLWFPVQLLRRGEALEEVVEWAAPTFDSPAELFFLSLLGVIVLAATRGAPWRVLLPSLGFFATGLLAVRNISVAALVIVVLVAPHFRNFFGTDDGASSGLAARALAVSSLAGLLIGSVAVLSGPGLDLKAYPTDEVSLLEERSLLFGDEVGFIHREAVGNYLTYRYGADAGVFIDDRFDFYPISITQDHLSLIYGGDYEEILDRREGNVVLWESKALLSDWLRQSDGWDVIVEDDSWLIACRRSSDVYARCRP